jgi:DNA-directed RNA polymerase specialized sigma24 family protein
LAPLWFETLTEGMDTEERQAVMGRVVRALTDEEVAGHVGRPQATERPLLGRGRR